MKMEEYLNKVTEQIRFKAARKGISKEMSGHILDQMEAYMVEGMDEEEALDRAVLEMGDPVETGIQLDRIHRPQISWDILAIVALISVFSILLAFGLYKNGNMMIHPSKHMVRIGIGFLLMCAVYFMDYSVLGRYATAIAFVFLAGVIGSYPFYLPVNGRGSYLPIGFGSVAVPIVMYLFVPIFAALLYHYRGEGYLGILKIAAWAGIAVWYDMSITFSNGILLGVILFVMFMMALWRDWYSISDKKRFSWILGSVFALSSVSFVGFSAIADYRLARVSAWLSRDEARNYVGNMAREILEKSYSFGSSSSAMRLVRDSLPGFDSELALISFVACFGIFVSVILLGLFALMIARIFLISMKQQNDLGMMVSCGCGLVFFIQIFWCVLQTVGLIPISAIVLPFISLSGSGCMVSYILLGLVLSVLRYKNVELDTSSKKLPRLEVKLKWQ